MEKSGVAARRAVGLGDPNAAIEKLILTRCAAGIRRTISRMRSGKPGRHS